MSYKEKMFFVFILIFTSFLQFTSCSKEVSSDPLPSWNDGKTKQFIINFINDITNEASPDYVKPEDRIATFDNDGTPTGSKVLTPLKNMDTLFSLALVVNL